MSKLFRKYISLKQTNITIDDIYYSNNLLLISCDIRQPLKGLPVFADVSVYRRLVVYPTFELDQRSKLSLTLNNQESSSYILRPQTQQIRLESFIYFNNRVLNSEIDNGELVYGYPAYLIGYNTGSPSLNLNGDFVIELSFYSNNTFIRQNNLQVLFQSGDVFSVVGSNLQITGSGFVFFIQGNSLKFAINNTVYTIIADLNLLEWYDVCLIRSSNTIYVYVNRSLVTQFINITNTNITNQLFYIGCAGNLRYSNPSYLALSSFTGAMSNIRITDTNRYPNHLTEFKQKLSFPVIFSQPKTDTLYQNVIFYYPFLYDLMEYGLNANHFRNKSQWTILPPEVGGLIIDETLYETNFTNITLSSEWCLEFYFGFSISKKPNYFNVNNLQDLSITTNTTYIRQTILFRIYSNNNDSFPVLEIGAVYSEKLYTTNDNTNSLYLYLKISTNNSNYVQFAGEVFIMQTQFSGGLPEVVFDDLTEYKFFIKSTSHVPANSKPVNSQNIPSFYNEPPLHFAIQRIASNLAFLINGEFVASVPLINNVAILNNYKLVIGNGEFHVPLQGQNSFVEYMIKGLRFTNSARYSIMQSNNFYFENSIQPLPLADNRLEHPRFRILGILLNNNEFTDSQEVSWIVSISQRVNNLTINDFTLTQLEGLSGATLISLEQLSPSQYIVTANTGVGSGKLTLNFIDRKTITLFRTSILVSSFVGELNFSGETYTINRNLPEIILTSTSSPYVFAKFSVKLTVTSEVFSYDISKIAIVNGNLTNFVRLSNSVFTFDITPIQTGAVTIQVSTGFSQTSSGVLSILSPTLTRIFDRQAVVLQLPLTSVTRLKDVSPSNITFNEISISEYDTVKFPTGETSSLKVQPLNESGGLFYRNFSILRTLESLGSPPMVDYTFELFYRKDIAGGTSHIYSNITKNGAFSIISHNGNMVVSGAPTSTASIFNGVVVPELLNTFNHVAITRRNGVVRLYMNGLRRSLSNSLSIEPFDSDIEIGYREFFVNQPELNISNIRIIVGVALYTGASYDIPRLPYNIPLQIQELTTLLNYITIYSTNPQANRARVGDSIILRFSSIISLTNINVVIAGQIAEISLKSPNEYEATILVTNTLPDGLVQFSINIPAQQFIQATSITNTTNSTFVLIDNLPLSVTITPLNYYGNQSIFDCKIEFSRDVNTFSLNLLTLTNCIATNLLKLNSQTYTFTVRVLSTGVVTLFLESDVVQDIIGNFNLKSNVVTRTITVPPIFTDAYGDNVLLYLLGDTLTDISGRETPVNFLDVVLDYEVTPPTIESSFRLNGVSSRITFDIGENLYYSLPYTIELFVYIKGNVNFTLQPPTLNFANNVQNRYFELNWNPVPNATSYEVFVSNSSNFSSNINRFTTNTNSIKLGSMSESSISLSGDYVSNDNEIGILLPRYTTFSNVIVDISIDSTFSQKNSFFTKEFYYGTIKESKFTPSVNIPIDSQTNFNTSNILHGIIGNYQTPFLFFVSQENTMRFYDSMDYKIPAVFEDVEIGKWYYVKLVNNVKRKKLELYVDNEFVDSITSVTITKNFVIGQSFTYFQGNVAGVRITKGVARPVIKNNTVLPYGIVENVS